MTKNEQLELLQRVGLAVLEAITEAGEHGAPAGVLYAALMHQGMSLSQFQSFMVTLTSHQFVTLDDGHCYRINEQGKQFLLKLQRKFAVHAG